MPKSKNPHITPHKEDFMETSLEEIQKKYSGAFIQKNDAKTKSHIKTILRLRKKLENKKK